MAPVKLNLESPISSGKDMIRRKIKKIVRKIKSKITQNSSSSKPDSTEEPNDIASEEVFGQQKEDDAVTESEPEEIELEVESTHVHEWIKQGKEPLLVDIRQPYELQSGYIPSAMLIPMNQLATQVELFPKDRPIVLYCAAGARSFGMAHFMRERGFEDAWSLIGGVAEWNEFAFPISSAQYKFFDTVQYKSQNWVVWGIQEVEGKHTYRLRKSDSLECVEGISEEEVHDLP